MKQQWLLARLKPTFKDVWGKDHWISTSQYWERTATDNAEKRIQRRCYCISWASVDRSFFSGISLGLTAFQSEFSRYWLAVQSSENIACLHFYVMVDAYLWYRETDQPTPHPLVPHINITGFITTFTWPVELPALNAKLKDNDFRALWGWVFVMACKLIA